MSHVFIAAQPDPKPPGWVWWKDHARRATCSCGWQAPSNSSNAAAASREWGDHRKDQP